MSRRLPKRQCLNNPAKVSSNNINSGGTIHWKLKEKQQLVQAIRTHGIYNLEKLANYIKTRNASEIRAFLGKSKKRLLLKYNQDQKKEPEGNRNEIIIKWVEKLREAVDIRQRGKDYSSALEQVFELAAKDELEPKNGEPNFSLIYKYLATALSGCVPPSLPPLESWLVLHAWQGLSEVLKQTQWQEEANFLKCLDLRKRVPLEPEYQRVSNKEMWKRIHSLQSSTSNGTPSVERSNINEGQTMQAGPSAFNNSRDGATTADRQSNENLEPGDMLSVLVDHCYPSTSSIQGRLSGSITEGHADSQSSDNCLEDVLEDYPIYNTFLHAHGLVLTSLNPLTVPVAMLERENEIIFS